MSTYAILLEIRETSSVYVCIVSVAIVVAHANAMVRVPLRSSQRWLLWATLGTAITSAAFVDVASITRPWQQDMLGRLAGAAAIMAGCGTLALLVLARVNRQVELAEFSSADVRQVTLICPRCHRKQTVAIENGTCPACGLGIAMRLVPA
jgi:hypothetical protein